MDVRQFFKIGGTIGNSGADFVAVEVHAPTVNSGSSVSSACASTVASIEVDLGEAFDDELERVTRKRRKLVMVV